MKMLFSRWTEKFHLDLKKMLHQFHIFDNTTLYLKNFNILNHFTLQEKDQEMAKLQQIIRECTRPIEHAPKVTEQSDFSIFVEPITGLDVVGVKHEETDTEYPTVTVKVSDYCSKVIELQ